MSELLNIQFFSSMDNRLKHDCCLALTDLKSCRVLKGSGRSWAVSLLSYCDFPPVSFPPPPWLFFSLVLTFTSPRHLTLNICLHPSSSGRLFSFLFFTQCSLPCNLNIPNMEGHLRQQMQITQSDTAHRILPNPHTASQYSEVFSLCWFKQMHFTLWSIRLDKSAVLGTNCRTFTSFTVIKKSEGRENSVQ